MRIFIFSYRKCNGKTGGSGGVNYKIYLANLKYKVFDNLYNCFEDIIIEPNSEIEVKDMNRSYNQKYELLNKIQKGVKSVGLLDIIMYERKLYFAGKWIKEINKRYCFKQNDVYLFQDVESAIAFFRLYSMQYTAIVYHQQGGLYAEWKAFNMLSSEIYHKYLTSILKRTFSNTDNIGFPSFGAKASLCESEPLIKEVLLEKHISIVYNGFDKPQNSKPLSSNIKKYLDNISSTDKIFITVAQANYAKGIERIPLFIRKIRDRGMCCKWILISNGEMGPQIEKRILEHSIESNVIWIKDYIAHSDILHLFAVSDFYILFHRWSIFDFSTIEAMAYGNIPILTPVGGNLEVVDEESGFLVNLENMDTTVNNILDLSNDEILLYKERNEKKEAALFSSRSFINLYDKFIEEILYRDNFG